MLAVLIAAPGCLLTVILAGMLVMGVFGRPPEPVNLSEAAATSDEAEVVRLIEFGEDPNVARDIRPGLLSAETVRLTPLEAAVEAGDPNVVNHLFNRGVLLDANLWTRVRCRADNPEITALLDQRRPSQLELRCDGTNTP